MAQRGRQALSEYKWQRQQYAQGVQDGLSLRRDMYSDQYYQKGYRRGLQRAKRRQDNSKKAGERR